MTSSSPRLTIGVLCIIMMVASACQATDIDYYSPENVLLFAEQLYREADYWRAAAEYQRYLFLTSSPKDSILFRIGVCYQRLQDHGRAIHFFTEIPRLFSESDLLNSAYVQAAYSHIAAGDHDSCEQLVAGALGTEDPGIDRGSLTCVLGLSYLLQRRWDWIAGLLDSLSLQGDEQDTSSCLTKMRAARLAWESLPHRSPFVAATLSAVVPGSGKIYSGRYVDGLTSFVLIGLAAWQASVGFNQGGVRSQRGWIYATVGGVLWAGNIYGSWVAAKIYNSKREEKLLAGVKLEITF